MSNGTRSFVIVGGGLAGAKAAQTLREENFDGRIVLIGEEDELPYERPPLSKGYLLGKDERDSVFVQNRNWYAENRIELWLMERVNTLDPAARSLELLGGNPVSYDKLLLATGSEVRRIDVPGADLAGVHYLRRLADSDRLREALTSGARIVVVGGGWIGLEVAAAAREKGCQVTLLEIGELPLQRVLGGEVAQVFADLHRERGVDLRVKTGVREFRGTDRVSSVVLDDGTELSADAVVVGVGVTPATRLAEQAGLAVDNGVLVDASLRTSDPHIYAAGDIANADSPLLGRRIRVEHWANALAGGAAAARSMMGFDVVHDPMPYFFTDQYDLGMEYAGYTEPGKYDEVVFRGDVAGREFIAFWLAGGRVVAGMNVNVWDVTDEIQRLIRSGKQVDPARLADPDVALTDLP